MTDQATEAPSALIGDPSRAASARSIADDLQTQIGHIFELARAPWPPESAQLQKTLACLATVLEDRANILLECAEREASIRSSSEKTARELGATQYDRDELAARVAELIEKVGETKGESHERLLRITELEAVLREVLGGYWEKGYVGCESVRTPWISADRLEQWRRTLAGSPE